MSYSITLTGQFNLDRPLTVSQLRALEAFADTRHDWRTDKTVPQYGYHCLWVATKDGTGIWASNGGESFHAFDDWLKIVIDRFIKPWGLVLNGTVEWKGEEAGDLGKLVVVDNVLTVFVAELTYVKRGKQP